MKITCISDTHAQHDKLQLKGGDLLLHSGDIMTSGFDIKEVEDFAKWFAKQPYKHKILIAGNHDRILDDEHMKRLGYYLEDRNEEYSKKLFKEHDIVYLNDGSVVIEGLVIHGSPVQPWFFNWAFNRERGEEIDEHWQMIPDNTDILLTHGPPMGVGDLVKTRGSVNNGTRVGCDDLRSRLLEIQPKLHIFGHIHEGYGTDNLGNTKCVNASVVDQHYRQVNDPIEVELN